MDRLALSGAIFILLPVAMYSFLSNPSHPAIAQGTGAAPEVIPLVGPVSLDQDLRTLPYIPPANQQQPRLGRHPSATNNANAPSPIPSSSAEGSFAPSTMPTPTVTFGGIDSAASGCLCLPPDTDGDVSPNYYIQSVNASIKIFSKTGATLSGPTTYNSFFSAMGASTPCGKSQNQGDGIVFYDHIANRWVVSDFAFPAFPGTSFWQCIGVSKGGNPVSSGWWLYAMQVDPSNSGWVGDYPKFGLWPDAYYLTVNLFSNTTTFNGVRVYALPRSAMINGMGRPNTGAVAFSISAATLGNIYSLLPATFRYGAPTAGTSEYFLAINSSASGGAVENQVFAWRFHVDFDTPANSTFGTGVNHTPDGVITVTNFVDAIQGTTTDIVPQPSSAPLLDSLGDKLMYPLYYQNLNGVESLYAVHTVNNNQGGTGPTAIRWYQFDVTGGTIPASPTQQQTFNHGADGLWRWMPSLAVDERGDVAIGYSVSSGSINPGIRYAGRLATDAASLLAQGEAVLINGGGHQTFSVGRWGDYSATSVDPANGCTFWHTNEYYSATSSANWNTRIGAFKFPSCNFPSLFSNMLPSVLRNAAP